MSDELARQMEMVQMLQMQFMDMRDYDLAVAFIACETNFKKTEHVKRAYRKCVRFTDKSYHNEYNSFTEEDRACIAVTLALHLAGVEE